MVQVNLAAVLIKVVPKMQQQILEPATTSGMVNQPLQLPNLSDGEFYAHNPIVPSRSQTAKLDRIPYGTATGATWWELSTPRPLWPVFSWLHPRRSV